MYSAPSTTTSSSLSRADSLSTMEYLQSNSHAQGGPPHRRASPDANASANASAVQGATNAANQQLDSESKTTAATAGTTSDAKDTSSKSTAEQGRNSSKRAAQNRAAQRAFRQRKDLYVRELERKAELLQVAESQLITLAARNRELEAMFAAQQQKQHHMSSSPLPSPLPQHDPHGSGPTGTTGPMGRGSEWDREREWARERAPFENSGPYDHFHSPSSPMRPAIGRHSSAQHLRQAYSASSPPLSNGSSYKHLSLNSKLSMHFQQQRPDSDHEIEMQGRPLRHLHRHPSESSLNLSRIGSFPTHVTNDTKEEDYGVASRIHSFRSPMDSRGVEMSSPSSSNKSPMSGPHDTTMHHYPSSPLSPTHERMPLYTTAPNPRSAGGTSSGSIPSPTMAGHGELPFGPSSSSASSPYDLNKKRPSDGTVSWSGGTADLYRNAQDGLAHPYYHAVKKQSSWSSLSEQRRLHAVKKQPSWGSISEHRHHWRTKTESPEMMSADVRFGGSAPALPRIPAQFSQQQQSQQQPQQQQQQQQRPPPPQQQHSFEREYPSSPAPFSYSPTASHAQQQQQQGQHARQSSDYYSQARPPAPPSSSSYDGHGPSDMEIVQEGTPVPSGNNGAYGHQGGHEAEPYEAEREREERYGRPDQHSP
ncbi:hypothetical protein BGZ54_006341 [Gamsiella multidivaricata]|nr:hypothetical protein BGZ54_006341 [Gamsiella multidivaricata]